MKDSQDFSQLLEPNKKAGSQADPAFGEIGAVASTGEIV